MKAYKLDCGCVVERKTERIVKMCDPCRKAEMEQEEKGRVL